ncbi:unnamed protein product, partial [marine sediment metagenome]
DLKKQPVVLGGKLLEETYDDYQKEMNLINKAFIEVLTEGDMNGRPFTFPIPTYNLTRDFDWETENARLLLETTAKLLPSSEAMSFPNRFKQASFMPSGPMVEK